MHRLSAPQRPERRFGKAMVREGDGKPSRVRRPMPNETLTNENGQRNCPKCPKVQERPKNRGFCGVDFGQGGTIRNCPKLSEFIRLSGPPPNRPQINPSKPL